MTYSELRALFRGYVLAHETIPDDGFVWGQDARLQNAMAGRKDMETVLHVQDVSVPLRNSSGYQASIGMWQVEIRLFQSVASDIDQQEQAKDSTWTLAMEILNYLYALHQRQTLTLNMDSVTLQPIENEENDGVWGWSLLAELGDHIPCVGKTQHLTHTTAILKPLRATDTGEFSAVDFSTDFATQGQVDGLLAIGINATTYGVHWEGSNPKVLHDLAYEINGAQTAVIASTDGAYLYLKGAIALTPFTYDLTGDDTNQHSWEVITFTKLSP